MAMNLTYFHVLLSIGVIFGLIGFLRGVAREVATAIGIIIACLILRWGERSLTVWVNRLYRMGLFAVQGGLVAEDPTPIWAGVRELPPLIETDSERLIFRLFTFALFVLLSYIAGNKIFRRRPKTFGPLIIYPGPSFISRFLGITVGLINGYLVANFAIPRAFPEVETVIRLPSGPVVEFLQTNLAFVFIGLVVILITLGLGGTSLKK